MVAKKPITPKGLGTRGRRFWADIVAEYELNRDEVELLAEVCRSLDQIDALRAQIEVDGLMVPGSMGQQKIHPGVPQINATRTLVGRLLAQLGLPDAAAEALASPTAARARKAANVRWMEHNRNKQQLEAYRRGQA